MDTLFEINDKSGRVITLTRKVWKHILQEHPYLSDKLENLKETLVKPFAIRYSEEQPEINCYYRHYKDAGRYLFIAVKYLNGTGFVITSFYRDKIK